MERRARPQCRGIGGRHHRIRHAAPMRARLLVAAKADLAKDLVLLPSQREDHTFTLAIV